MKNPIKRFADFLGVAGYLFVRGFSASKIPSLICIFFEALSFIFIVIAAISVGVLASAGKTTNMPEQLMRYIPEGQSFTIGILGLTIALLGGAVSKYLANYIINIALPKIESNFYAEGANNLAETYIVDNSELEIDVDEYLKRHLSINARFAMMVYRRLILTFVPVATLFFFLPALALTNVKILLAMGLIFLCLIPIYYWINRKSNQITLDMEELSREVSGQRRKAALTILDEGFHPENKDSVIAPTLAKNNSEIKQFFHLYGERFTMSEATNLTNTFVLVLVLAMLAFITNSAGDIASGGIDIAYFLFVLVALRQIHTVISRGLLVTNTMSRFYTKLLSLKTVNETISKYEKQHGTMWPVQEITPETPDEIDDTDTENVDPVSEDITPVDEEADIQSDATSTVEPAIIREPVENLSYKQISITEQRFDMQPGTVHLYFDKSPPSLTSLPRLLPETDAENFETFLAMNTVEILETQFGAQGKIFSFAPHIKTKKSMDNILAKHFDLLSSLYDESELRRIPEEPMEFIDIMKSTLGDGISYLRPRTIKIYELMIDLQEKIRASDADIVILDAKALIRLQPPYAEMALKMMEKMEKIIFVMIANHNYEKFKFDTSRMVLISGPRHAEGFVALSDIGEVIPPATNELEDELDDEWM